MLGLKYIFEEKGLKLRQQEVILGLLYLYECFEPASLVPAMTAVGFEKEDINKCFKKISQKNVTNFNEILNETNTENNEVTAKTKQWLSNELQRILQDETCQKSYEDDLKQFALLFAEQNCVPREKEYDAILVLGQSTKEILESKRLDVIVKHQLTSPQIFFVTSVDQVNESQQLTTFEEFSYGNLKLFFKQHNLKSQVTHYHDKSLNSAAQQFVVEWKENKQLYNTALEKNAYLKIFHELAQTRRLLVISGESLFDSNEMQLKQTFANNDLKAPEIICQQAVSFSKEKLFEKLKSEFIKPKEVVEIEAPEIETPLPILEIETKEKDSKPTKKRNKEKHSWNNSLVYGSLGLALVYGIFASSKHPESAEIFSKLFFLRK